MKSPARSHRTSEVDKHIGQRIRARRLAFPMTQKQLADSLDPPVTFQQVQKYEHGTDRVTASRLYQISNALEVAPGLFFPAKAGALTNVNGVVSTDELATLIDRPDTIRMLRAFKAIPTVKERIWLIEMVETRAEMHHRYKQVMSEHTA